MRTKVIGILLIILGISGVLLGLMMFGDIGIACIIGALGALLSGIGFVSLPENKKQRRRENEKNVSNYPCPYFGYIIGSL